MSSFLKLMSESWSTIPVSVRDVPFLRSYFNLFLLWCSHSGALDAADAFFARDFLVKLLTGITVDYNQTFTDTSGTVMPSYTTTDMQGIIDQVREEGGPPCTCWKGVLYVKAAYLYVWGLATSHVNTILQENKATIRSGLTISGTGKFGRYLVDLKAIDGSDVATAMIGAGFKKKTPVVSCDGPFSAINELYQCLKPYIIRSDEIEVCACLALFARSSTHIHLCTSAEHSHCYVPFL